MILLYTYYNNIVNYVNLGLLLYIIILFNIQFIYNYYNKNKYTTLFNNIIIIISI